MAELEKPNHGEICWRELQSPNIGTASEFYRELFGWQLAQSELTETPYLEIHGGENKAIGGMLEINEHWGENWENIPSAWMSYIAVEDILESVEKIKNHGGSICVAPFEAPGIGKMSVVSDPSGIAFSVIQFV